MTDSTDKKSTEKRDQSSRHESLHSRLNSIDKKSQERRDNFSVDLDAMLDEAESSLLPMNESQDDEDAIDRLLMNAGFDTDDALMQTEVNKKVDVVKDDGLHDELDDFLSSDGFGDDFNESGKTHVVKLDQTIGDSSRAPLNGESQDDGDDIDRLLMNVDFNADDVPVPSKLEDVSALEQLNDFSGFSDFDKLDMIQNDEIEASAPAVTDLIAANEGQQTVLKQSSDDKEGIDNLLPDAGFNAEDALEQTSEKTDEPVVDVGLSDKVNDFSDFDSFGDDFDELDMILDEDEVSADLAAPKEERKTVVEQPSAVDLSDEVDNFSDFGDDFDGSDMIQDEIEASAPAVADLIDAKEEQQAVVEQPSDNEDAIDGLLPDAGFDTEDTLEQTGELVVDVGLSDEVDDFDESDLVQDDEVETSISADLIAVKQEPQAVVEESVDNLQDDENNIDTLLMEAGYDVEDTQEQTTGKKDEFGDDADLDEFFQLDEVSDDFSKQTEEVQLAETEESSTQEDDFLLPDFDITADTEMSGMSSDAEIKEDELADAFGDTDFLNEDEAVQALEPETAELKSGGDNTDAEDIANVKSSPFGFEQQDIKKQLQEAENKVKKAKLFSYVALGFGAVAVSAAVGLGVMTYGAKTEVSKLTEAVSALEANLAKSAANNPHEEINAMRNSIVQLNQQVDGFITELKGNPQFPVDLLNSKVPDIAAKQGMVSKALDMLQAKMEGEEKVSLVQSVIEPSKIEAEHAPAKEAVMHEHAPIKEGTAHEPAPTKEGAAHELAPTKEEAAHEIAPTKERAMHEAAPAKVEAGHETVPAKMKVRPETLRAKPITTAKTVAKEEPANVERQAAPGKWGVNLVAVKQEWYAKSKVAEFARRGIFAEVIPIQGNNTTMYRLRVGGFKSKGEAYSNTTRIKKALNLNSVWVSDD